MTADGISQRLTSRLVGRPLRVFQEATSTNDLAGQLGNEGAPEGVAIFAERQLAGRGRLGRSWQSARGESLTFSILLRPAWPEVSRLSLAIAVALCQAIEPFVGQPVGIKWPNDLQILGKKIAGILCEAGRDFIVVGIGLNVLQTAEDFPKTLAARAGSLAMFGEQTPDREALAVAILEEIDRVYASLPAAFPAILAKCAARSTLVGKLVAVERGAERLTGEVTGLDAGGGLVLQSHAGEKTVVTAGEVTLLEVAP